MSLSSRKQKLRTEVLSTNNSVNVSLKKLESFGFKGLIWARYQPLKDEPVLNNFPKNVKFCSPRTVQENMDFVLDDSVLSFSKSSLGVKEPSNGEKITKDQIDLMLIPGLAFDNSGNRLGRGKGFYDRFLKDYKGVKVGVCSKDRFLDFPLPVDPEFDVPVDFILTEDFVYQPVRARKGG